MCDTNGQSIKPRAACFPHDRLNWLDFWHEEVLPALKNAQRKNLNPFWPHFNWSNNVEMSEVEERSFVFFCGETQTIQALKERKQRIFLAAITGKLPVIHGIAAWENCESARYCRNSDNYYFASLQQVFQTEPNGINLLIRFELHDVRIPFIAHFRFRFG